MPQTINGTAVITLKEWTDAGLTFNQYENDKRRYFLKTIRACNGQPVLIEWSSILEKRRAILKAKYGDLSPKKFNTFADQVHPDPEAYDYYSNYKLNDGRTLPLEVIAEYCNNAAVLTAAGKVAQDSINMRKALGNPPRVDSVWQSVTESVAEVKDVWPHSLPENTRRLRDKYKEFMQQGYDALIHRNFCNQNSRKVSREMEDLFIALYTTRNRHFAKTVRDLYLQFLDGEIEVADVNTGEIFDRADFIDQDGNPLYISESTTWGYLAKPANRQVINKYRHSGIDFKTRSLSYNHRRKPEFTFSKVSFDDRDLPHKTIDGISVKCYYAYEPLSQCFIAWAHSRDKNIPLIIECFRSLLSFTTTSNFPWPGEIEVERHLMTQLKKPLEEMFSHVRWCNPTNSREKRAEHGIKLKKYGAEKLNQVNVGRWSNVHDAYKTNQDLNILNEFDDLVADDIYSIHYHNNQPHPAYPGKTRLQVLREMINPKLSGPVMRIVMKNIGNRTETSVRNFDFVRVNHKEYRISDQALSLLKPNNYEVTAYWLPDENGDVKDVYLYQGDVFICQANLIETYNEAFVERTALDEEIRIEQEKHNAHIRKRINDRASELPRVEVIRNMPDFTMLEPEILSVTPDSEQTETYDSIIADADYWEELGRANI